MSTNHDVIAIFAIYGQFGAIEKSNSGYMVHNFQIFVNNHRLSSKYWKLIKDTLNTTFIVLP